MRMRRLAWLNIAVQMAFPLAGAFTPAIAGVNHEQHFLKQSSGAIAGQQTTVYTLTTGETVATVAKKYHMSVDELRQLNALRTFAHGFDHLQPGDELDVPVAPLATVTWDTRQTTGSASDTRAEDPAMKVASAASQAGGFLANHPDSDAAASMARGMASGAASEAAEQWLRRFGTARVQLDTDEHFSLKNSQLDLLAPLYDSQTGLLFTQGSVHRTDDRSQTNLGLGYRWFNDGWMLGMNTFWDNDWSHNHTRGGVGMEYWRDFLKVSGNDYFRLSGWKDSPDVEDYQERPANGWDVRLQGWLPALPQLGGKLTYEQYYGDEVGLFGKDNRQRNPHAVTAGLTYTPVPLLTFSAEQRQGESGENDTRFGVEMNYQLGIPWRRQLDPAGVAALRTLNGSRYDLVERNNNIVLEYRRKEVIRLRMADQVTGHGGESKSLGVSVTSKYGVDHIDWTAPALLAAGGKIVANGGSDYSVVLPVWQSAPSAVNNYTVSAVAVDTKGNRSERSQTQVTVQKPDISQQNSTLTPVQSTLPADGRTTETLTLTIKDGNGAPEDVALTDIHISTTQKVTAVQGTQDMTVSDPVRKGTGVYEMTVTAGTKAETATVRATVDNVAVKPATITVNSSGPSELHSAIGVNSTTYESRDPMTLTVTLQDENGNGIPGKAGDLAKAGAVTVPGAKATGVTWAEGPAGQYTATYTAATAVTAQTATLDLGKLDCTGMKASQVYTITAATPDLTKSAIETDHKKYMGGAQIYVTVTLKDKQGNAVTNAEASLTDKAVTVPSASPEPGSSWTDNKDGTYSKMYRARYNGSNLRAVLSLEGWTGTKESQAYDISYVTIDHISVNGGGFWEDAGFPRTGFKGAKFTILLTGWQASEFDWKSNASWVTVSNGTVKFIRMGTREPVVITATPKSGDGTPVQYTFKVEDWYEGFGNNKIMSYKEAIEACRNTGHGSIPAVEAFTTAKVGDEYAARKVGSLWGEWGNPDRYSGADIPHGFVWTSTPASDGNGMQVVIELVGTVENSGSIHSNLPVVCRVGP